MSGSEWSGVDLAQVALRADGAGPEELRRPPGEGQAAPSDHGGAP
ncbi:hypothetical protein ACH4UM_34355 [Streptomyces sp. NPDC020801]